MRITFLVVWLLPVFAIAVEIPLTVEEAVGVARRLAPVSSGICFPRGAIRPEQKLSLWDGATEVPLQVTPLVIERDGSLRWALLDFQLSVGAKQRKTLTLRTQEGQAQPAQPLHIEQTDQGVRIDTGQIRFTVSRTTPFRLFEEVKRGDATVARGGVVEYSDGRTGQIYAASRPGRLELEYHGPLRVTIRVDYDYDGPGDCRLKGTTRITAWAGRSDVRIQHILANTNSQQVYHANVARAALGLHHTLGRNAVVTGAQGLSTDLAKSSSVWLHQGKVSRYYRDPIKDAARAGADGATTWEGAECGGWIALGGREAPQHGAILVCDRDFFGDPPRRLIADERGITCEFMAQKSAGGRGVPHKSEHAWIYDLSHRTAEVWIDFAAVGDLEQSALASRSRLLALAPPAWYSDCDVLAVGPFGSLEDEKAVYGKWGWAFAEQQVPRSLPSPGAFVRWEDNHYESEADSAEALLLMALRTGQRGFFDQGEAWARYHANLHAWRTDAWVYDDGAIWFPQGGPLGTRPARKPANIKYQQWDKGSGDDQELWHLVQGKACYCHFYGAGLVDYFLLTGERDFLEAAVDLVEQKNSEFRKHRQFTPGKTTIDDTRGFGRGFYVIAHVLEAMPQDRMTGELARLCRDVLWRCPDLDERGFAPSHIGTGFGGFDPKRDLPPEMKRFMESEGITLDERGVLTDRSGRRWPVVCLGGTWQHYYVHAAADRYARLFGDEDMIDFTDAFGRFVARYMLSEKCHQTWYYAYMDVPIKGVPWDPWKFQPEHVATRDGEGCIHEGYYTRFFPDAMARAYSWTGDAKMLDRAREFWHYGSKRGYRTPKLAAGTDAVGEFAMHVPPKDDSVLSTSRLFHEWAHPRQDAEAPEAIRDLVVTRLEGGRAEIRFTAPADRGGGRVVRYQVKCAELPIAGADDYDFGRDDGVKRNFWRATNLQGEPLPSAPGSAEKFIVSGVPEQTVLHFAVASFDDSNNRSAIAKAP